MRSFTLIITGLAALAGAAPILNSDVSLGHVIPIPDSHQSLGSSVSSRDVADGLVGQLKSLLQSRSVALDNLKGNVDALGAEASAQYNNRRDLAGGLASELEGALHARSNVGVPNTLIELEHGILHPDSRDVTSKVEGFEGLLSNLGARNVLGEAEGILGKLQPVGRSVSVNDIKGKVGGLLSGLRRDVTGNPAPLAGRQLSESDILKGASDGLLGTLHS